MDKFGFFDRMVTDLINSNWGINTPANWVSVGTTTPAVRYEEYTVLIRLPDKNFSFLIFTAALGKHAHSQSARFSLAKHGRAKKWR